MTPATSWTEKLDALAAQAADWLARWGNLGEEPPDKTGPHLPAAGNEDLAEVPRWELRWEELSQQVTAELRQWQQELDELTAAVQQWQRQYRQLLQWWREWETWEKLPRQPA